jgi:hypothetical protein
MNLASYAAVAIAVVCVAGSVYSYFLMAKDERHSIRSFLVASMLLVLLFVGGLYIPLGSKLVTPPNTRCWGTTVTSRRSIIRGETLNNASHSTLQDFPITGSVEGEMGGLGPCGYSPIKYEQYLL